MYYQLPNGKTIWLDVNDILNLTDRDIRELVACNAGEHIINPWHGASIKNVKEDKEDIEDEEDETETYYKEYFPDEFPEIPDDDINFDLLED
jgi:hypothetical protein